MKQAEIEINIGELVLDGVAPAERRAVSDASQRALAVEVTRHGVTSLLARPDEFARQASLPVTLAPGAGPEQMGAQVAASIARSWR